MRRSIKIKQKEIEYRKSQILDMRARGLSQRTIAQQLHVTDGTISLDLKHIGEEAQQNISNYVLKELPIRYRICLQALEMVLKELYEIIQSAEDLGDKLEAIESFKQTHYEIMEHLVKSHSVEDAISYIENRKREQEQYLHLEDQTTPSILPPMEYREVDN
jgi:transcriptional regulator